MWNLKSGTEEHGTCLQGRYKNTDVENKSMDTKGGERGGIKLEIGVDIHTRICIE